MIREQAKHWFGFGDSEIVREGLTWYPVCNREQTAAKVRPVTERRQGFTLENNGGQYDILLSLLIAFSGTSPRSSPWVR
jgi:hypothetical protein